METTKKITNRFVTYFILLTIFLISNGVTYLLSERMFVNHLQEMRVDIDDKKESQNLDIHNFANEIIEKCIAESPKGFRPIMCKPAIEDLVSDIKLATGGTITLTDSYVKSLKMKAQRKHFFENTMQRDYVNEQ